MYADSRFVGVRCCECEHPYLYDEIHDRLFLEPNDLTQIVESTERDRFVACRSCGATDWAFKDVLGEDDTATFVDGPWGFSFWKPSAARKRGRGARIALTGFAVVLLLLGATALAVNPDPLAGPGKTRPQVQIPGG